jgi:hypothetical protein
VPRFNPENRAAVLLLLTAIHNAWDAVAYRVLVNVRTAKD